MILKEGEDGVVVDILAKGRKTGIFLERLNRFVALVQMGDQQVRAHLPNSGRLKELLRPGAQVLLLDAGAMRRKTRYTLAMVKFQDHWVCIIATLANEVFAEAVGKGLLGGLAGSVQREVNYHGSRIDFLLGGDTWVEVKSATCAEGAIALFPDAPTERGRKHLRELMRAVEEGYRAMVVFVAMMEHVTSFAPHGRIDPRFAALLRRAAEYGVMVKAYRCRVQPNKVELAEELDVLL